MKCRLGAKKLALVRRLGGREYSSAWVRGGWKHFQALCFYDEGRKTEFIDYSPGRRKIFTLTDRQRQAVHSITEKLYSRSHA